MADGLTKILAAWGILYCVQAILSFIFGFVLPFSMLIMGGVYQGYCTRQYLIPVYLIVFGCTYILANIFLMMSKKDCLVLTGRALLGLFNFIWLIAGSVWVFGIRNDFDPVWHSDNSVPYVPIPFNLTGDGGGGGFIVGPSFKNNDRYCHPTLYSFAYDITVLYYLVLVVQVIVSICVTVKERATTSE